MPNISIPEMFAQVLVPNKIGIVIIAPPGKNCKDNVSKVLQKTPRLCE